VTGVCNRAHFFELAELERRRCSHADRSLGVVALDIDHFKRVNDTYGHGVGDLVLQAVAKACAGSMRPGDTFARLGGEEFVALLPGAEAETVLERAEGMRVAAASINVEVEGLELRVTASCGCAVGQATAHSISDLLERADKALYQAKRNGRNCIEIDGDERAVA
jgi:diguanylate cyclase (GGDEF)-like protein